MKIEIETMAKICRPSRIDQMESETIKIQQIQKLLESTVERLDCFATKNDYDSL